MEVGEKTPTCEADKRRAHDEQQRYMSYVKQLREDERCYELEVNRIGDAEAERVQREKDAKLQREMVHVHVHVFDVDLSPLSTTFLKRNSRGRRSIICWLAGAVPPARQWLGVRVSITLWVMGFIKMYDICLHL